jgi:hypothetical protein
MGSKRPGLTYSLQSRRKSRFKGLFGLVSPLGHEGCCRGLSSHLTAFTGDGQRDRYLPLSGQLSPQLSSSTSPRPIILLRRDGRDDGGGCL